ncbi:MAG: hypothetical protein BWK73_18690 [Thiothrix lacustris]|uniref:Uncharacterized protein n=1 Tax=Thiothrix lacustris TaxID=525917 RepID=A0A1Y1QQA3_9GAMM|nr:MAG: hypothetical protein BWK73_18690 [Thiothrix lacustris]
MNEVVLLAIVEVNKIDRVICRAPNCRHSVYKRIHVIKLDGKVTVYGSECFKQLLGSEASIVPHYGTSTSRQLTPEERLLLLENTESLIAQFEAETQANAEKLDHLPAKSSEQPRLDWEKSKSSTETVTTPVIPQQQVSVADEWAKRQAARESWQRGKLSSAPPIHTPQPIQKEWENWEAADWEAWAKRRFAGKAPWIETPEAMVAWKALMVQHSKA